MLACYPFTVAIHRYDEELAAAARKTLLELMEGATEQTRLEAAKFALNASMALRYSDVPFVVQSPVEPLEGAKPDC